MPNVTIVCPRCRETFEFRKPVPPPAASRLETALSPPSPPAPPFPPPQEGAEESTATPHEPPLSPAPEPPSSPPESAGETPPPSTEPTPVVKKPIWVPPPAPPRLLEVGELFGEAWDVYRRRWLLLVGLLLLAAVTAALPLAIVGGGAAWLGKSGITIDGAALILLVSLAAIAALIAFFRGIAAVMAAAVDDGIGFREALSRGKATWIALLWASSLYGFIVGGASLLFLIPGVLTGVWFFASPYMAAAGDARGMEALLKSRAIVKGRFWPVLLRLFQYISGAR